MLSKLKTLVLTDAIRYRIALVRRAEHVYPTIDGNGYGIIEVQKIELATEVIEELERQEHRRGRRRLEAIERPSAPVVVDLELRPKRRHRA